MTSAPRGPGGPFRWIRAELAKLLRPLLLWCSIAMIAFALAVAWRDQAAADSLYGPLVENLRHARARVCDEASGAEQARCLRQRETLVDNARRQLVLAAEFHPLAEAAQHPVSTARIASGLVASLVGALLLAAIAGGQTAGEWERGTIRPLLVRQPVRMHVILAKFATTWIAGMWLIGIAWAALAIAAPFFSQFFAVPPGTDINSSLGFALDAVGRGALVVAAFAALVTLAAVVARNALGTVGLSVGFIVVSWVTSWWSSTYRVSPGYWVGAWMGFERRNLLVDHVWVDAFPGASPDAFTAIALVLFSTAALVVCHLRMTSEKT